MYLYVLFFCQYSACWYDVLHCLIKLFTESAFAICVCVCLLLLYFYLIFSRPLVIRKRFSGKSSPEQEIKAIYPSTLWMMCTVLSSVLLSSVADRWTGCNWRFISNPFIIVPNGPVTIGKIFVLTFHILMTSISRFLYCISLSVPCVLTYESSGMVI